MASRDFHVTVRSSLSEAGERVIEIDGPGFTSKEELASILLLIVERLTGVSTTSYCELVDAYHRIVAREHAAEEAESDS